MAEIGWKTLQFMRRLTKGCLTILSVAFRKPVSHCHIMSYHSVVSQCTVTISSSNLTLTTLGMLMVVPKSFHKSVATASSHAILKTSHQGSWHRGGDPHGMRSCHPMPCLRCEMSEFDRLWSVLAVLGWRLARNVAYISAVCCLSSICLSCDRLQYCLWNSYARPLCFFCTCLEEQSQVSTGKFLLTNSLCSTPRTRCNTNMQVPLSSPHLHLSALLLWQKRHSIAKDSLLQKAISVCGEMVRVRAKFRYTSASGKASKIASAIPCARPSYTPYFWRQVDISPHEILYFRHFRLHETQPFDSGSRAQGGGVGWNNFRWTWNHVSYYDTLCTHARC